MGGLKVGDIMFIVFEGIDGVGKSTQLVLLHEHFMLRGMDVIKTKEPTDGYWGQKIRSAITRPAPETEAEWFLRDRQEHVAHVINPALENGEIVLCDRYYFSTMAYQGARGYDIDKIETSNREFSPLPDLVILFDMPPYRAMKRVRKRGKTDSFEDLPYLEKVDKVFQGMEHPFIWRVDADKPIAEVQRAIRKHVYQKMLG